MYMYNKIHDEFDTVHAWCVWMEQAIYLVFAHMCMAGFWDSNQGSENHVNSLQRNQGRETLPVDDNFLSEHAAKTNLLDNSSQNMEQYMWYLHMYNA